MFCTLQPDHSDQPGVEHVVKFRQGKVGTAALVSEVLCTKLLASGGVSVLDICLVDVSPQFAASYMTKSEIPYSITVGQHFGSVLKRGVENGPPSGMDSLTSPQEVVDIWAFDSWFCNTDRSTDGNTLLALDRGGKLRMIAADQSDCFGGAGRFADGSWQGVLEKGNAAQSVDFLSAAIFAGKGVPAIQTAVDKVRIAAEHLDESLACVPVEWWTGAGIDPKAVKQTLNSRCRRLPDILNLKQWEGLDDVIEGGHLL